MTRRSKVLVALAGILYVAAVTAIIVFAIRAESTRSELRIIQRGPAVRCVQGHDNACDKLRRRLLVTASPTERQDFADAIEGVVDGGGNNPSGQRPPSGGSPGGGTEQPEGAIGVKAPLPVQVCTPLASVNC